MNEYKDLNVWQKTKALVVRIYEITKAFPDAQGYGIAEEMRRSVIFVPCNIAKGCWGFMTREKLQFLTEARNLLFQLDTQICIAHDLGNLKQDVKDSLIVDIVACQKMLSGLISHNRERLEKKTTLNQPVEEKK
ncbi:four helix bundle protein [Taibaiella soli]|nr:four helix bundle protein [Taibaiella soli]